MGALPDEMIRWAIKYRCRLCTAGDEKRTTRQEAKLPLRFICLFPSFAVFQRCTNETVLFLRLCRRSGDQENLRELQQPQDLIGFRRRRQGGGERAQASQHHLRDCTYAPGLWRASNLHPDRDLAQLWAGSASRSQRCGPVSPFSPSESDLPAKRGQCERGRRRNKDSGAAFQMFSFQMSLKPYSLGVPIIRLFCFVLFRSDFLLCLLFLTLNSKLCHIQHFVSLKSTPISPR